MISKINSIVDLVNEWCVVKYHIYFAMKQLNNDFSNLAYHRLLRINFSKNTDTRISYVATIYINDPNRKIYIKGLDSQSCVSFDDIQWPDGTMLFRHVPYARVLSTIQLSLTGYFAEVIRIYMNSEAALYLMIKHPEFNYEPCTERYSESSVARYLRWKMKQYR